MRLRFYLTTGLLMLAGCGQSSDAAPAPTRQHEQPAAPARFDVAGVAVGDSLRAATAALRDRGFTVHVSKGGWTFDDWVENSRAKAEGRMPRVKADGPKELQARKGVEFIYANLRAAGDGAVLETVGYTAPSNGRPREQLLAEVKKRYSNGFQPRPTMYRICAKGEQACTRSQPEANYVQFNPDDPLRILLFPGARQERQWRAEFDTALRKRLGPAPASY
jgi:ribosomal protein S16